MPTLGVRLVVPKGSRVFDNLPNALNLLNSPLRGGGRVAVIGINRQAKAPLQALNSQSGEEEDRGHA
eukprot:15394771-Alexandrium_andersonii.AAC.1